MIKKRYPFTFRSHHPLVLILAALAIQLSVTSCARKAPDVTRYVNPMTGTAAATTVSAQGIATEQYGNTIPAVGVPFQMTGWTPQTRLTENKCVPPYYYKDSVFTGIRATHWLNGSCTQDYGSVTFMPLTGSLQTDPGSFACSLDHRLETSTPYYYRLSLPRYHLTAEVTATARAGVMRYTAQKTDSLFVVVTPNNDSGKAFIRINRATGEIEGYNPVHRIYQGSGQPAGFSGYFVIRFEKPFLTAGTFDAGGLLDADSLADHTGEGAWAGFRIQKGESLLAKVGTSFTSIAEARNNLDAEIPGWDFGAVENHAKAIWQEALGKIQVAGGTESERKIFYTALYHTMQQPRLYNDVSGTYPRFATQYQTERLRGGNYYGDFSMWDIYRAEVPLYEILDPAMVTDWVRSMILKGQQGGWMPIFPCWNHYTAEMIGDHVTVMIASAYMNGIRDFDVREAYRLMRQNAFDPAPGEAYLDGKGRRALDSYLRYGYIPLEDGVPDAFHKREQVSRTLEYAYDDYCLALVAGALGNTSDEQELMARARNYRNVFDTARNLMNGRHQDGSWDGPFTPDQRMSFITEGTPRQYSFYVPQDVPGLASLMGGRDSLEAALDSLFTGTRYNHGNEPDQQAPFLYNYTAHPWKTQRVVRRILREQYGTGPGGLSGNDDAGAISAWYVLASVGLYPVDPASGKLMLSSPVFDKATISLEGGKRFTVRAHKKSSGSIYIRRVTLNGKAYDKNYLSHDEVVRGGQLDVYLDDTPGGWGGSPGDQPAGL